MDDHLITLGILACGLVIGIIWTRSWVKYWHEQQLQRLQTRLDAAMRLLGEQDV